MTLEVGDVVGGAYEIERRVGEGGMGAVYVAVDLKLGRKVALKVLHRELPAVVRGAERFRREARAASRVRHPCVVEIYAADIDSGTPWIAMELLRGETLAARLKARRLEIGETLWVADSMLGALTAVEAEGLVHRDIKPENIFLDTIGGERRLKLLDFGIAKPHEAEAGGLTDSGMVLGTPHYFSPEQATAETLDIRSDLFSLAIVLYECVSGRRPFEGTTYQAVLTALLSGTPPSLDELAPDAPAALRAVIRRALSRARDDRFESAAAMRDAVRAIPGERRPAHLSDAGTSGAEPRDTELSPAPVPARESSPVREDASSSAGAPEQRKRAKKKKKKTRVGPGGKPEVTIAKTVAHDATPREARRPDAPAPPPAVTPWTYGLVGLLVLMIGGFVYLVASSGGREEPVADEERDSVPPASTPPDEPLRVQPVEPVPVRPAARPPAPGQAPAEFDVVLDTTKGDIRVHVTRAWAPNGADRFYELVRAGYFDDVAFFRVIEGFMAQVGMSGDPATNARWEDRTIADDPVRERNTPGMVTFAATGRPNSRTTQFFINLGDNSRLDDMGFAPFGRTTDLSVVRSLYAGYGEGAPRGRGPEQGRIAREGNAYLRRDFPLLDYVRRARIVE